MKRTSSLEATSTSSSNSRGCDDLQGLDRIDWYGLYGREFRGSEGLITNEKKLRWLQSLRDFHSAVTSTRARCVARGESHTFRAWMPAKQEKTE